MRKVGILGGGQLGRMLLQAAANYNVEVHVLEKDSDCPAAQICGHFTPGDIRDYDDVLRFGQDLDAVTIEIESVNSEALHALEGVGVKTYPRAHALDLIKNKIDQKRFYKEHGIPSAEFLVTAGRQDLESHMDFLPAVHKLGQGGYDGRGVQILRNREDLKLAFDSPSVLEKVVHIEKEISEVVAMAENGETAIYPPVDMVFDPYLNLLDYQLSPADIPKEVLWKVEAIALRVVKELKSPGIFAVELFVDRQHDVLVNETAPRVHNSGHHTIEANYSSQFDMLWRIILGHALGNTNHILPAAMVNLLGAEGFQGPARYDGLEEVMKMDNAFAHIYGKKDTRGGRKMGHVTILGREKGDLVHCAKKVKQAIRVVSD